MIEVEIKIKIDNPEEIIQKLETNGFKRSNTVRETDIYFNGNDHDFRKSDEALRIRKTESLDGSIIVADGNPDDTVATITYKGRKLDDVSMTRPEVETVVQDFDTMYEILVNLGFRPVKPVIKKRTYYFSDNMTALIDDVEGLGDFLELEIMADNESERKVALKIIQEQLVKLGLEMEQTTTISYLSMLE